MRTIAEEMLSRINAEIKLLNYDNDITADDALHMVKFITPLYSQLRKFVSDYVFPRISLGKGCPGLAGMAMKITKHSINSH